MAEYKIFCKICCKECLFDIINSTFRCNDHYNLRYYKNKRIMMETLYYTPYTLIKCNNWDKYEVWFKDKIIFHLNIDNFKDEKYIVNKIKTLHIFS